MEQYAKSDGRHPNGFQFHAANGSVIEINSSVLCVDLDGTLTPTDTLHECLIAVLRHRPWLILWLPFWLRHGREHLKLTLAKLVSDRLRMDLFPRRAEVVRLIETARAHGRRVELVSATHQELLGSLDAGVRFDAVHGSRDGVNLKGNSKAALLQSLHSDGFAYIGDSSADVPVWRAAKESIGVNLSRRTRRKATAAGVNVQEISRQQGWIKALLTAMRPHQWAKNLLVFVSLGLSMHNVTGDVVLRFVEAFCALCLLTSGTYIINDLADLTADRQHRRKRFRPLASGALPIAVALLAAPALIAGGLLWAYLADPRIAATLFVYLCLTLAYSFWLKRLPLIDVVTISTLFTSRMVAGAFGYEAPLSHWLLIFSLFLFTSLALMKRSSEIMQLGDSGTKIAGRGYLAEDRHFVFTMGMCFGVGALIIFALYISEVSRTAAQYREPDVLWLVLGMVGFWIMRMWFKTSRGEMHDDPILFAVRDRGSLILGALSLAIVILAQFL